MAHLNSSEIEILARKLFYKLSGLRERLNHLDLTWVGGVISEAQQFRTTPVEMLDIEALQGFAQDIAKHLEYTSSLEHWLSNIYEEFKIDYDELGSIYSHIENRLVICDEAELEGWISVQNHIYVMHETFKAFDDFFRAEKNVSGEPGYFILIPRLLAMLKRLRLEIDMRLGVAFVVSGR